MIKKQRDRRISLREQDDFGIIIPRKERGDSEDDPSTSGGGGRPRNHLCQGQGDSITVITINVYLYPVLFKFIKGVAIVVPQEASYHHLAHLAPIAQTQNKVKNM
jgi:hypothetical protein